MEGPRKYSDFVDWMGNNLNSPAKFRTLGGRSEFTAWFDRTYSSLMITTSSGKTHKPLAFESIEKIFQRYMQAPPDKDDIVEGVANETDFMKKQSVALVETLIELI